MAASTEILLTVMVLVKQSCINAVNFHLSVCESNPVKESTSRIIKLVSQVRPKEGAERGVQPPCGTLCRSLLAMQLEGLYISCGVIL